MTPVTPDAIARELAAAVTTSAGSWTAPRHGSCGSPTTAPGGSTGSCSSTVRAFSRTGVHTSRGRCSSSQARLLHPGVDTCPHLLDPRLGGPLVPWHPGGVGDPPADPHRVLVDGDGLPDLARVDEGVEPRVGHD